MELEKSNETVWSIKRRGLPGNFVLRSTEQAGEIIKVTIALEDQGKIVAFEMKYPEFINFYGILSSFKALIESPEHLNARRSSTEEIQMMKESKAENISINEMNEHAQFTPLEEELFDTSANELGNAEEPEKQTKLDEGLKNLEKMFADFAISKKTSTSKEEKEFKSAQIKTPTLKKKSSPKPHSIQKSENTNNDEKLKETDWDPW